MTIVGRPAHQPTPSAITQMPAAARQDDRSKARFADLLDGLVKPCNGAVGFLGDPKEAAPGDEAQAASVFNGRGFFGSLGSQNASADHAVPPAIAYARVEDEVEPIASLAPSRSATIEPLAVSVVTMEAAERSPTDQATRPPTIPGLPEAKPPSAPIATKTGPAIPTKSPTGGDTKPELPTLAAIAKPRFAPAPRDAGTENRVGVLLQATERGQIVVAHTAGLDRAERIKLRDRIVGFLARHGLAAHAVRIDGRGAAPDFAPDFKEKDR